MNRKKEAFAAATVAAVIAAALWQRKQSTDRAASTRQHEFPVRHASAAARNARLASLGAKAGGTYAVHRARRVFASAERKAALDLEFEMKTAEQVAEALGQMKGALMKLGQMASYLDQGLPEHVRAALADLQKDAPPMSAELAAQMVHEELGADPTEVFHEWDPVPIASASIGQVHRAITNEGIAVAVKVQYPGVDKAVGADLENVGLLFAGVSQLFPGFDHKPFVEELRERLAEELDYRIEAANQRLFADYYEGHPFIHIPRVLDEYSTARVLTTELAEGVGWNELLTWDQHERNLAAETLYRFAFGSLYRLRAFNGDPHPGNYLFRPGGQVTFLDFGLVKHFTEAELENFEHMIRFMVLEPDAAKFRRTIEDIGLLRAGEPFTDEEVVDYFGHFYEFIREDGEYTITAEYASETVRRFFDQRGPYGPIMKAANLPPAFVIIQRINLGLYALFGELNATGNWRRLAEEIWPWVAGPPAGHLGDQIAHWDRRRHG
ncbi:MAG: AarF/ABC1/UbiB kinase family protein [Acidimicrobiales bacterium]|nr:AarF/ABC1/UbiB kinase family protein [Acidimicrobiales bacterium]